jgi:hypothetical protein
MGCPVAVTTPLVTYIVLAVPPSKICIDPTIVVVRMGVGPDDVTLRKSAPIIWTRPPVVPNCLHQADSKRQVFKSVIRILRDVYRVRIRDDRRGQQLRVAARAHHQQLSRRAGIGIDHRVDIRPDGKCHIRGDRRIQRLPEEQIREALCVESCRRQRVQAAGRRQQITANRRLGCVEVQIVRGNRTADSEQAENCSEKTPG